MAAKNSNPQTEEFDITIGALGYRTRSDVSATNKGYLTGGSQNVLINEATDKEGDKVESRAGYEMFGSEDDTREGILNEFTFKTKTGDSINLRFTAGGELQFYSETEEDYEVLLAGLDGDYRCRFTTVWNGSELIRELLFVNHSTSLWEWSGATATLSSVVSNVRIDINETIATRGFLTSGTRKIRIKDSGGTWREATYTGQSGSQFTVTTDLTAYTFAANAPVVQVVRENTNQPASGFINDVIKTLDNHVYVGSHSSSIVYMSKSTSFTDYTFSSPRLAVEGWQFVLDDYTIGFETNLTGSGEESMVMFAGNDWMYRAEFIDITDTSISQIAKIRPIVVSSGQGAIQQELIAKIKNSIVYLNAFNELLELANAENSAAIQQTPISDPIKPDFLAADFTGGQIRLWRNNVYVTAPASGRVFILAFREENGIVKRFWQPPQILPVGQISDYGGDLIGHSAAVTESYTLFTGTSDNGNAIEFKAYWAYNNFNNREKLKNFDKIFVELYMTSNAVVALKLLYEYYGAKAMRSYDLRGDQTNFLFIPVVNASLGVNSLATSPLGASPTEPINFNKYKRFKKVTALDHFEYQIGFECSETDAQFQILCHGANSRISTIAPVKIID